MHARSVPYDRQNQRIDADVGHVCEKAGEGCALEMGRHGVVPQEGFLSAYGRGQQNLGDVLGLGTP